MLNKTTKYFSQDSLSGFSVSNQSAELEVYKEAVDLQASCDKAKLKFSRYLNHPVIQKHTTLK